MSNQPGTRATRPNPNLKLHEPTTPTVGDRFPRPRPDVEGSSGGFSSPKPEPPNPTDVIYKSGNIQGDPREIWWDSATFDEIQARSWPYLVRSGEIWGDPSWFRRFLVQIYWVFADSSEFFEDFGDDLVYFCLDLVSFAKNRWRFDVFLLRSSDFCTNPAKIRWKIEIAIKMESPAASFSTSTDSTADQTTPIWPDPLVFAVGGGFSRRKPNVIGSVSGWAQTRPGPTRGHP